MQLRWISNLHRTQIDVLPAPAMPRIIPTDAMPQTDCLRAKGPKRAQPRAKFWAVPGGPPRHCTSRRPAYQRVIVVEMSCRRHDARTLSSVAEPGWRFSSRGFLTTRGCYGILHMPLKVSKSSDGNAERRTDRTRSKSGRHPRAKQEAGTASKAVADRTSRSVVAHKMGLQASRVPARCPRLR